MSTSQLQVRISKRHQVVLLCFLAQNMAMGLAYGSFGPLLASTETQYGVSRAVAALGMSSITLAIALASPLGAALLRVSSMRTLMVVGALMSAVGYGGLATGGPFGMALAMFVLIGAGVALLALLGPLTLVNRWFAHKTGRMLGFINLPIAVLIVPWVVAVVLPVWGRPAVLTMFATLFVLLVPLLFLLPANASVTHEAEQRAVLSSANEHQGGSALPAGRHQLGFSQLAALPSLWLLSIGIAIVAGSATAFVVHAPLFGMSRFLSPAGASGMLSIYALAGIFGTLLSGFVADLIGPVRALAVAALLLTCLWGALSQAAGTLLFPLAAMLGLVTVPWITLHGTALGVLVGPGSVGRAMGVSYIIKLPFVFVFPPVVGALADRSGGYALPLAVIAGALLVSAILFVAANATVGLGHREALPHPTS